MEEPPVPSLDDPTAQVPAAVEAATVPSAAVVPELAEDDRPPIDSMMAVEEAIEEAARSEDPARLKILRVIEVAFDPRLRKKFVMRNHKTRSQIDAAIRESSFYEDAAERFNDEFEHFNTKAYGADDWICDIFSVAISLPPPASEDKVNADSYRCMLADLHAKFVRVSSHNIVSLFLGIVSDLIFA
jgi:hypothetical protein